MLVFEIPETIPLLLIQLIRRTSIAYLVKNTAARILESSTDCFLLAARRSLLSGTLAPTGLRWRRSRLGSATTGKLPIVRMDGWVDDGFATKESSEHDSLRSYGEGPSIISDQNKFLRVEVAIPARRKRSPFNFSEESSAKMVCD